ncbi:MAG: hypothetical protein ACXW3F_14340 [Pyrinomonadaceae bacterium]
MRKHVITTLAALTIFFAAAFTNGLAVQAQGGPNKQCHLGTLKGSFGYLNTGTAFGTSVASVGIMMFDGTGNVSGKDTNSFGGSISSAPFTGSYTVTPDCTGTLTINFGFFTIENNMVIVDNGKEINIIETNPGTIATGVMKRQ